MVLVVAFVLVLLRPSVEVDSLDCGRRIPVGMTLCDKALDARLLLAFEVGDSTETEDMGLKEVGADGGLEVRRRSFSLSLTGEGESSMMSTQPDESPPGVRLASVSKSMLAFRDLGIVANRSSLETEREEEAVDGAGEAVALAGMGGGGMAFAAARLVTLPIRSRGTRV